MNQFGNDGFRQTPGFTAAELEQIAARAVKKAADAILEAREGDGKNQQWSYATKMEWMAEKGALVTKIRRALEDNPNRELERELRLMLEVAEDCINRPPWKK